MPNISWRVCGGWPSGIQQRTLSAPRGLSTRRSDYPKNTRRNWGRIEMKLGVSVLGNKDRVRALAFAAGTRPWQRHKRGDVGQTTRGCVETPRRPLGRTRRRAVWLGFHESVSLMLVAAHPYQRRRIADPCPGKRG
jgi:hypothetical protein